MAYSLGWLFLPETRSVEVYRADGSFDTLEEPTQVYGEGSVAGFVLDTERIWRGIRT